MATPVSIGDAIVLAQIAYKIGLAFTTGRKSAPAEFEEIQKLLWTLSEALKLVAREFPETGQTGTAESSEGCGKSKEEEEPGAKALLITLISNCQGVLEHLDHLVKKYSDIDPKAVGIRDSERRCWKDDFWRNWKKVKWTREGGGLDTLKKSLNVHLAGLNLALSAINNRRSGLVLEQVDSIHTRLNRLDVVYEFVSNLLLHTETKVTSPSLSVSVESNSTEFSLRFEVWVDLPGHVDRKRCCPHASFAGGWLGSISNNKSCRLFQCHCEHMCRSTAKPCNESGPHQQSLTFSLLPVSLLVRLAEPGRAREWEMFVKAPGYTQAVKLVITGVHPSYISDFEVHVEEIALCQSRYQQSEGLSTSLISFSIEEPVSTASVLNMKGLSADISNGLLSGTMVSGDRRLDLRTIQSVQLLHYRRIGVDKFDSMSTMERARKHLMDYSYAELILTCQSTTSFGSEVLYIARIEMTTPITQQSRRIQLKEIVCTEESEAYAASEQNDIRCSKLELCFSREDFAQKAIHMLHSMQQELWVSYYRSARWGETVILERENIGRVQLQDLDLPAAGMRIIFDPTTNSHRLIFLSNDHSLSICLEMSEESLSTLTTTKSNTDRATAGSATLAETTAWVVEVGIDNTLVSGRPMPIQALGEAGSDLYHALLGSSIGMLTGGLDASTIGEPDEAAVNLTPDS